MFWTVLAVIVIGGAIAVAVFAAVFGDSKERRL